MLDLFFRYMKSGDNKRALLAGQNMVNHNPGDKKYFEVYFDFLVFLAQNKDVLVADSFLQQATGLLAFFSENVEVDENIIDFIISKENELNRVAEELKQKQENIDREAIRQEVIYHNDAMELLEQILEKIKRCESSGEFNKYVDNLAKIDQSINRDRLSERQAKKYVELTRKSSDVVSSKMAYFENVKNRGYNISALEAYEKVFNMFKNGKVVGNHKEIIKGLFMFDTSRLYNETLVYYNHVYNYILGQLSDEEKFTLTKYAVMSERKG